jgi:SurA N-terminal domain
MDEKKSEGETFSSNDTSDSNVTSVETSDASVSSVSESTENEPSSVEENQEVVNSDEEVVKMKGSPINAKAYIISAVVILVIGAGLLFLLEKEGRISTGLFSGLIEKMEAGSPAAKVNGEVISQKDFDSSLNQLLQMASQQGEDPTDQAVIDSYKTQAIDTLVNAELLRQAAIKEGVVASPEAIEARYAEIEGGLGGAEQLAQKMLEFGVTAESLRRDIENEILITDLFKVAVDTASIEVTEEEVNDFYNKAKEMSPELPALEEVRSQVETQVRFEKEQEMINAYLQSLKSEAEIEVLI